MGGGDYQRTWHFAAETPARSMHWAFFEGYKQSGRTARNYRVTGLLGGLSDEMRTARKEIIDRLPLDQRDSAIMAGAYRLGDAIMATEIELPPEDGMKNVVVGFGVGKGNLEANIGVYVPEARTFHPLVEDNTFGSDEVVKRLNEKPRAYADLPGLYPYASVQQL